MVVWSFLDSVVFVVVLWLILRRETLERQHRLVVSEQDLTLALDVISGACREFRYCGVSDLLSEYECEIGSLCLEGAGCSFRGVLEDLRVTHGVRCSYGSLHRAVAALKEHERSSREDSKDVFGCLEFYIGFMDLLAEFRWLLEQYLENALPPGQLLSKLRKQGFRCTAAAVLRAGRILERPGCPAVRYVSGEELMCGCREVVLAAAKGLDGNSGLRSWLLDRHGLSCSDRAIRKFFEYDFLLGEQENVRVVPSGLVPEDVQDFVGMRRDQRVPVASCLRGLASELKVYMSYGSVWEVYQQQQRGALPGVGMSSDVSIFPRSDMECLDGPRLLALGESFWGLVQERDNVPLCLKARVEELLGVTCSVPELIRSLLWELGDGSVALQPVDGESVRPYADLLCQWNHEDGLSVRQCASRLRADYAVCCSKNMIYRVVASSLRGGQSMRLSSVDQLAEFGMALHARLDSCSCADDADVALIKVLQRDFQVSCVDLGCCGVRRCRPRGGAGSWGVQEKAWRVGFVLQLICACVFVFEI